MTISNAGIRGFNQFQPQSVQRRSTRNGPLSYSLLNGSLEWNDIQGSKVSLAAWRKNLANREYYTGGFALGAVTGINSVLEGTLRMYGVTLSDKF